jgi:hypothetical protein
VADFAAAQALSTQLLPNALRPEKHCCIGTLGDPVLIERVEPQDAIGQN